MSKVPLRSTSSPEPSRKRPWYIPTSFRTRFILLVGAAVVFDLLLGGGVALWNVNRLGREASTEIQAGLEKASREYLENYIQTTALRASLLLGRVHSEVSALATSMQTLVDQSEAQEKIGEAVCTVPYFSGDLQYDPKGNWMQNGSEDPSVVSVWGYLLDENKKPRPDVLREIQNTAVFDLVGTSLMATGSKKLQMYYIGPKDRPIFRTTPYSDQAQTFDKLYPGHNEKNFWDFFFPGVYEGWQGWIRDPKTRLAESYVTSTAPYVDAITGNLIVSFFHPLWTKDRTDCAGAVGADISLEQLSQLITNVRVADTGFAFLGMSNGNVLAITKEGEKTLGLAIKNEDGKEGVTGLDRSLAKSIHPEVAALQLPNNEKTVVRHVNLTQGDRLEPYVVVLRRLDGFNLWTDGKIGRDYSTLGFVVPEHEIYATVYAAQAKVSQATARIRHWQFGILLLSLAIVLSAVFSISGRITGGITALSTAASRIEKKDYSVRVDLPSRDEIGALGQAFNKMASEIETHTATLEQKVEERTERLAAANHEIQALNEKLKDENVRMGAELDVARRMQKMVLPRAEELRVVPTLEIAGYMEPACEVGGDYYDVLQSGSLLKVGIGDVTGHGLESGVLMIMVQSVVRTLLESGESDPKRFLAVLNSVICKNVARTDSGNNLTLSFIDYTENTVTLTGQHEMVIIIRLDGTTERIDTIDLGFPVGLEMDISQFIQSRKLRFDRGDLMILHTDGVTEAENPGGELYGFDRLCETAHRLRAGTAHEVQEGIVADVFAHIDSAKIHDDITLVVLKHL